MCYDFRVLFQGIGVDIVEVKRFTPITSKLKSRFIEGVFTPDEIAYCRAFKDAATHFAGTFAAKEAACKALGGVFPLTMFEIKRTKDGKPEIWRKGKKDKTLAVSISHDGAYAVAVCVFVA